MSRPMHSKEFITKVFELSRTENLSAKQIAEILSPEYKQYRGVNMTRNAVIGILNRHDDRFIHLSKKEVKRINFSNAVEQLEHARQGLKNKDQYRVRKCLSCRKEKLLHRVMFVCDTCKSSSNYTAHIEDYSMGSAA